VDMYDWVSADLDGYVERCIVAAADLTALAKVRAELRPRFAGSPLRDATGLARLLEATYRSLWDEWRVSAEQMAA